jgi:hypothetical protein
MTLDEFREAFASLREMGFVQSRRPGPTGIGHTLEQMLGLAENNVALPDLGEVELKAHRINSRSMITLFTFNRNAWKIAQLDAIRMYGTPDAHGRLGLYFTMSLTPNSQGLFLHVEPTQGSVAVRHVSGALLLKWTLDDLVEQFRKKIPALLFVSAFSEKRGNTEWFQYCRAQLLTAPSAHTMGEQLRAGNVFVDLRLHDQGTRARNHGTGFRANMDRLPLLFESVRDL